MNVSSLNNKSNHHALMLFSPSVIIKRITRFLRVESCFEIYKCVIFSPLCGTYNALGAIVLLFVSNFFQYLLLDGFRNTSINFVEHQVVIHPNQSICNLLNYYIIFTMNYPSFLDQCI